jgi:IclR family pca regulon transcriptional regulator
MNPIVFRTDVRYANKRQSLLQYPATPFMRHPIAPASGSPATAKTFIRAFARGLLVIRSFDAQTPSQTISGVAAKTGLDRAGARRILHTLNELGYIRCEDGDFHLTPRVLGLGFAYFAATPIWVAAERITRDLVKRINETCSIGVLDQSEVLYVVRVPAPHIVNSTFTVGSRVPAYCSSTGRLLLGALPSSKLKQVLRDIRPARRTTHTLISVARLVQAIQKDARRGWSLVNQELELGLCSIAVPILDAGGSPIAAISVSGSVSRLGPSVMRARILPQLQEAAAEIGDCARIQPIPPRAGF